MSAVPLQIEAVRLNPACAESTFSCRLEEREILLVTGENGSGKSRLLSRFLARGTPGGRAEVRLLGRSPQVERERAASLAAAGVLFQMPGLWRNRTVEQNVAMPFLVHGGTGVSGETLERTVARRLELVGCAHLADFFPEQISEGDRRLVALARALSGPVRVLLADEPVLGLSPARRQRALELIDDLVRCGALLAAVVFTQESAPGGLHVHQVLTLRAIGPHWGLCDGPRRIAPARVSAPVAALPPSLVIAA